MAESSIGGHTNPKYNETIWRCIRVIVGIDCKTYKHVIKRRVWAHYTHARTYIQCITHLVHIYSCLKVSLFFSSHSRRVFFWFVWIACSWYRNVQVKNVVFDRTIQNTHTRQHEQKNIFENYVILDEYLERERVSMFIYVVLCVLRAFFSLFHFFIGFYLHWTNDKTRLELRNAHQECDFSIREQLVTEEKKIVDDRRKFLCFHWRLY